MKQTKKKDEKAPEKNKKLVTKDSGKIKEKAKVIIISKNAFSLRKKKQEIRIKKRMLKR